MRRIVNMRVRDIPSKLNDIIYGLDIDSEKMIGYQIVPLPNVISKVVFRVIYRIGKADYEIGVEDGLAYNLTINDFKDFAQFVNYIGKWFPKTFNKLTKLYLSLMYSDYLYFKKLKED
jgi:hypothetical protein